VAAGENVWFAKHFGVRCEACGPHSADDERLPSRRPGRKAPGSPPTPRTKKARRVPALPDPTAGGGSMPGEHCLTRSTDGVWRYEFGSVSEAVADAMDDYAQNEGTQEYLRGRLARALSGRDDWSNFFTRARFLRELSAPSQHLLEAVDRMRERLIGEVDMPACPRRRIRRGQEFGEELDADRWLARDMAPWERCVRERNPRRTVTIGCNVSANGYVKPEQLLYRGAAALALADILSGRGVNVGIVLFDSRSDPTESIGRSVIRHVVKDPMMPLDVSAVAFAMCEIAYFRVVMAIGGMRHIPGSMNESLGCARNLPATDRAGLDFLIESDVLSEPEAVEWLTACMAGQESEVCHV
jgi:hypothetical protein